MQESAISIEKTTTVLGVYSYGLNKYPMSDTIIDIGKRMIKGLEDIYT